jgi:hypothetical protein
VPLRGGRTAHRLAIREIHRGRLRGCRDRHVACCSSVIGMRNSKTTTTRVPSCAISSPDCCGQSSETQRAPEPRERRAALWTSLSSVVGRGRIRAPDVAGDVDVPAAERARCPCREGRGAGLALERDPDDARRCGLLAQVARAEQRRRLSRCERPVDGRELRMDVVDDGLQRHDQPRIAR